MRKIFVGVSVSEGGTQFRRSTVRYNGSIYLGHGQGGLRPFAGLPESRYQADTHVACRRLRFSHNEFECATQTELERLLRAQRLLLRSRKNVEQEKSKGHEYE